MAGNFFSDLLMATKPGRAIQQVQSRNALEELAQQMASGEIPRDQALMKYAGISGDFDPIFSPNASNMGGATGVLIDRLMKENSKLTFADALGQVQTGFRKGVNFEGGVASPIEGLGGARGALAGQENYGKTAGGLQAEGQYAPQVEYDKTTATEDAKNDVASAAALPKLVQQVGESVALIDDLLGDEGLDSAVGGVFGMQGRQSSTLPLSENQRRVQPKIDQIKGKAFLQAFQDLKGAGAITENEGTAATKAMARLDQAQDEKSFRTALGELRQTLAIGLERHQKGIKADGTPITAAPAGGAPSGGGRKVISFGDLQ